MLRSKDLEFRINEYVDNKTVFVCNITSDTDQPQLGAGHRDVVGEFSLSEDENFSDLDREELFFLWMQKTTRKLNTKIRNLEREIDEKNREISQLERTYYVEHEDEL